MRVICLIGCLLFTFFAFGQRLVVPNQEVHYSFLSDPSFIGEGQRVELTGSLQPSAAAREQSTNWINAQVALYDNVAFGLDYFNDSFDLYDYSTIMLSSAIKFGLGEYGHHIKLGFSGGGESRKQDSRPLTIIPDGQNFVTDVSDNNLKFIYRAALHYTNRKLTLGGYFNRVPVQDIGLQSENQVLYYEIEEGFTGYAWYTFRLADNLRLTPVFRYLSYLEDAIYEGSVKVNIADRVEPSLAYRNDYSISPAVRFKVVKALDLAYVYEKALGSRDFDDIHGISATYRFFKAEDEEPEWLKEAKETIEIVEQLKENLQAEKEKSKEIPTEKVAPFQKEEIPKVLQEDKATIADEVKKVEEKEKTVEPALKTTNKKPETVEETGLLEKGFYIVVGIFKTSNAAKAYMEKLDRSIYFPRMGKKVSNGPFHVYIDSDYVKAEALKRLSAHRLDRSFKKAKLLEVE